MIDQRWAIIAHLDVRAALDGEAKCRLVLVDLEAGREAGELCVAARQWEKRRDVFSVDLDAHCVSVPVADPASNLAGPQPAAAISEAAAGDSSPAGDAPPGDPAGAPTATAEAAGHGPGAADTPGPDTRIEPCAHERWKQVGRCAYCEGCGLRFQGTAPKTPEQVEAVTKTLDAAHDAIVAVRREQLLARFRALSIGQRRKFKEAGVPKDDLDAIERELDNIDHGGREQSKCRSCGAAIVWAKTEAGNTMPLDAEPRADGNVLLDGGVAKVITGADCVRGDLHVSHFATCPNAAQHRGGGGGSGASAPTPTEQAPPAGDVSAASPAPNPDEGTEVDKADFAPLREAFGNLGDDGQAWCTRLLVEAKRAGVPIVARPGNYTLRRYEIYRGLIGLAGWLGDARWPGDERADEPLEALVWAAAGDDDATRFANVPAGHALGSLSAQGAAEFARLIDALVADRIQLVADDTDLHLRVVAGSAA